MCTLPLHSSAYPPMHTHMPENKRSGVNASWPVCCDGDATDAATSVGVVWAASANEGGGGSWVIQGLLTVWEAAVARACWISVCITDCRSSRSCGRSRSGRLESEPVGTIVGGWDKLAERFDRRPRLALVPSGTPINRVDNVAGQWNPWSRPDAGGADTRIIGASQCCARLHETCLWIRGIKKLVTPNFHTQLETPNSLHCCLLPCCRGYN